MADFGAPAFLVYPVALVFPGLELASALGLLWSGAVFWGAAGEMVLLVLFTAPSRNCYRARQAAELCRARNSKYLRG